VVYFQSLFGTFYALDAQTGEPLAQILTGGVSGGPAVSRGQIYLGTGDAAFTFLTGQPLGPGTIIALGLPNKKAPEAAAPSRPVSGQGSGQFTDMAGGFFAKGIATHLGAFTHYGTLLLMPTEDPNDDPALFKVSGRTVYEAANGDLLYAIIDATLNVATGVVSGTDTWDGGTGRFADASGTVDIVAQLLPGGLVEFTLEGVIEF
jgi:hypothetical protein